MKIKQFQRFVLLILLLSSVITNGQELWKKLDREKNAFQKKEIRVFKTFPQNIVYIS